MSLAPARAPGLPLCAMDTDRHSRYWAFLIVLLVAVIVVSGGIAWSKYRPGQPVEIVLTQPQPATGTVYVGGAVSNPGIYPLNDDDTISSLIQAAGGAAADADLARVEVRIPGSGEKDRVQKIDINRAEAWLLTALPGVGETRAKAIVEYRLRNGPFRSIDEVTRVEGMGGATYQRIKDLITVLD